MKTSTTNEPDARFRFAFDWTDVKFTVLLGVVSVAAKLAELNLGDWHFSLTTTNTIAFVFTVAYIVARARREPHKLDEWGLTTPVTLPAVVTGLALFALTVAGLAAAGILITGSVSFRQAFVVEMIEYIPAAFPQQFVLCSIGLVSFSRLPIFRGWWRLPLTVGVLFCLAHFWLPTRIPGTVIPVQMVLTLPVGFIISLYFLKFRNVLPVTLAHAVGYPLLVHWIEAHL